MWQRHLLPAAALPLQKLQNHRLLSKLPPKQMKLVEVYTRGKNAISLPQLRTEILRIRRQLLPFYKVTSTGNASAASSLDNPALTAA